MFSITRQQQAPLTTREPHYNRADVQPFGSKSIGKHKSGAEEKAPRRPIRLNRSASLLRPPQYMSHLFHEQRLDAAGRPGIERLPRIKVMIDRHLLPNRHKPADLVGVEAR